MKKYLCAIFAVHVFFFIGCGAPSLRVIQGAEKVKIGKSDPKDNYEPIGPVTAIDGQGCGLYGYRGTYSRAMIQLQNKTFAMGGNYAQIFTITEPHLRGNCYDNEYTISATAYKKVRPEPDPIPVVERQDEEDLTKKLRELKKLLDEGIITNNEFNSQKKNILDKGM